MTDRYEECFLAWRIGPKNVHETTNEFENEVGVIS